MNAPDKHTTDHYSPISWHNHNSWGNFRCDWTLRSFTLHHGCLSFASNDFIIHRKHHLHKRTRRTVDRRWRWVHFDDVWAVITAWQYFIPRALAAYIDSTLTRPVSSALRTYLFSYRRLVHRMPLWLQIPWGSNEPPCETFTTCCWLSYLVSLTLVRC